MSLMDGEGERVSFSLPLVSPSPEAKWISRTNAVLIELSISLSPRRRVEDLAGPGLEPNTWGGCFRRPEPVSLSAHQKGRIFGDTRFYPLFDPVPVTVAAGKERRRSVSEGHCSGSQLDKVIGLMEGLGRSMLYSSLLFTVILSLMEMYREKLASSEPLTILGGFISSLLFLTLLTLIGNFQESSGNRTGWGAVALAESVALIAAGTVHRVCITTCFLFSAALLYEVDKLSGMASTRSEPKTAKRY